MTKPHSFEGCQLISLCRKITLFNKIKIFFSLHILYIDTSWLLYDFYFFKLNKILTAPLEAEDRSEDEVCLSVGEKDSIIVERDMRNLATYFH